MQNIAPQLLLSLLVCLSFAHGKQPNILFCISDDQSYAHTGANGDPVVKTPALIGLQGKAFVLPVLFAMPQLVVLPEAPSLPGSLSGDWKKRVIFGAHCQKSLLPTRRSWPRPGIRSVLLEKPGVPGVSLRVGVTLIPLVWNFRKES